MQALVWQFILGLERPWILPFWNPSIYVTHNWGLQLSHDTSGVTAKGTADEGGLEERGCKPTDGLIEHTATPCGLALCGWQD